MSVLFKLHYKRKKSLYKRNDSVQVQVFYYFNKRKINISTGVEVKIKDWESEWRKKRDKNPVKNTDPKYLSKNFLIKQKVKEIEDIIDKIKINNQFPTTELIKTYLKKKSKEKVVETLKEIDFLYILELYRESINDDVTLRENYKRSIRSGLKILTEFTLNYEKEVNNRFLISDIDDDFQRKLLKYLSLKPEQPSTIRKRIKLLISVVNWCNNKNYTNHKIKIIKFIHEFDKEVIFLSREEVLKLYNYRKFDYSNSNHIKYTTEYITDNLKSGKQITYTNSEVYRDMIVFGCGVGCRYGDLVNLKLDNYEFSKDRTKGFFVFRMEKSRTGKQVKVPINNLTFEIWKKYSKNKNRTDYLFPRTLKGNPISNQKVNKHIKVIGEKVGLNRLVSNPKYDIDGRIIKGTETRTPLHNLLTTHIIRRTFIREGIENKIPTHILMSMSGHTTEKVFRKYFSTTSKELDNEGKKMFSLNLDDETKNEESKIPKTSNISLENQLKQLKTLFNKGLIPEEVYIKKVSELL